MRKSTKAYGNYLDHNRKNYLLNSLNSCCKNNQAKKSLNEKNGMSFRYMRWRIVQRMSQSYTVKLT